MRFAKIAITAGLTGFLALAGATTAHAELPQLPDGVWEFEETYDDQLAYVHSLANYAFDLEWQFEWERRRLADNALRLNTGSVSSSRLQTLTELSVNTDLNDLWRFQGRFRRDNAPQRARNEDELLLGLERRIFDTSALFVLVNPRYDKEFIDVFAGYTLYRDERQQYLRVGVLFEDLVYGSKNSRQGVYDQQPVALQWTLRLGSDRWQIVSEGRVGTGFERVFPNAEASPDLARHERQENRARVKLNRTDEGDGGWSVWVDWYDFREAKDYRLEGFDYDYTNEQLIASAEYVRLIRERHRLRLLAHYVRKDAASVGFREHDYERADILGSVFYEYLRPRSGVSLAYATGLPDLTFTSAVDPETSFELNDYQDKLILGWRYDFSDDARILVSVAHEVAARGFGGGNVQFQILF